MEIVDHFVDFDLSIADQHEMSELAALYVFATYFLDAFSVIGYLRPTGDYGVGKTQLLSVIAELGHLGYLILSGGTFATLRDMADYGALLAFDDAEALMDSRTTDPDKRALLLAGNRRGAFVTVKEPAGKNGWVTRYIHAFCPRAFSAIDLPDAVLGSRTIGIPLVRSGNRLKSARVPQDHGCWPHSRTQMIDALYATALANLVAVRECDSLAVAKARLVGRNLEPWRAILGVAYWLDHRCGMAGLFDRIEALSVAYQTERADMEADNQVRLIVTGLDELFAAKPNENTLIFTPTELAEVINRLVVRDGIVMQDEQQLTANKLGHKLKALRFDRPPTRSRQSKVWRVTRERLQSLAANYNIRLDNMPAADMVTEPPIPNTGTNGTNGRTAQPECRCADGAECAALLEGVPANGTDSTTEQEPCRCADHAACADLLEGSANGTHRITDQTQCRCADGAECAALLEGVPANGTGAAHPQPESGTGPANNLEWGAP